MIPENTSALIEKLKHTTASKQITWSKTSRDNEFKLALAKGAITIDSWNDDESSDNIDFVILNTDGDQIERLVFSDIPKEKVYYKSLLELHTLVRRSFYKVDETIQLLLNEVENKISTLKRDELSNKHSEEK